MYKKSINEFSKLTFSSDPVPGGGGVCGLVGALASSLSGMVTNLTIGKKKYLEYTEELESIRKEVEDLRVNLLECINKDALGFYPLSKAYSMDRNDPLYEPTMENCLKEAAKTPMMIMKYCVRIIEIDERLATIGSKLSVSDAGTSVMLAYGALKGAYLNVKVNTNLMKDIEYKEHLEKEALDLINKYETIAIDTYNKVIERLN